MRSSLLLLIGGMIALAGACGGKTDMGVEEPGDAGDGGSGSGGSGGSSGGIGSSGGGSGGSSGGIGSSGGGSGGGSGTSSGGFACSPLPGCNSAYECPEPGGCGTCYCQNGGWLCTGGGGSSGGSSSSSSGGGSTSSSSGCGASCPINPPTPNTGCYPDGMSCGWASPGGCGESCDCVNGTWSCSVAPCPPPACPTYPPGTGSACTQTGNSCYYPVNDACGEEQCDCDPSGSWYCYDACFDAGPPVDAGSFCPVYQPPSGGPCNGVGNVCSYYNGCDTNCLCSNSGWVCATQQGCMGGSSGGSSSGG